VRSSSKGLLSHPVAPLSLAVFFLLISISVVRMNSPDADGSVHSR
jgi:hypothetical protein